MRRETKEVSLELVDAIAHKVLRLDELDVLVRPGRDEVAFVDLSQLVRQRHHLAEPPPDAKARAKELRKIGVGREEIRHESPATAAVILRLLWIRDANPEIVLLHCPPGFLRLPGGVWSEHHISVAWRLDQELGPPGWTPKAPGRFFPACHRPILWRFLRARFAEERCRRGRCFQRHGLHLVVHEREELIHHPCRKNLARASLEWNFLAEKRERLTWIEQEELWPTPNPREKSMRHLPLVKKKPSLLFTKKVWKRFWGSAAQECDDGDLDLDAMPLESAIASLESQRFSPQSQDFKALLRRCTWSRSLELGRRLHRQMEELGWIHNRFLCNLLIDLYTKCDRFDDALAVFHGIQSKNVFSWTMMLVAFAENRDFDRCWLFFRGMLLQGINPGEVGISIFLSACTDAREITIGRSIQLAILGTGIEEESIVQTALVSMYGKLGHCTDAASVFLRMSHRDVVAWSAMVAAYARNGHPREALGLFRQMDLDGVAPNKVTLVSGLDACASLGDLRSGALMHQRVEAQGIQSGVVVGTALVNLYGKCGRIEAAVEAFGQIVEKNVVAWSAISAAYARNDRNRDAIRVLHRMDLEGLVPNSTTFVSVLDACAAIAALKQGRRIHERTQVLGGGLESDVYVLTALVNMYSKCGNLALAGDMFDKIAHLDLVLWNSLIATNAQHGQTEKALELFERMRLEGLQPTIITFTSVLFACSHAGMLDQGRKHFVSFIGDHGIFPEAEHFGCMVDLLGRAGWIVDSEDLLLHMPFEPHPVAWMAFLGACRTYRNMDRAIWAAENLFQLDPRKRAPYVLLSNMYAKAGRWSDVARMRQAMQLFMTVKEAGRSWIEVKDRVHEFISGDLDHPRIGEIHAELQRLTKLMKEAGYVPDTEMVLHDVKQEVKEIMVGYHSEKLAMAFALLTTPEGSPIRVVKNLRVCNDCHTASKFISKLVNREIVVRDCNRFHRFQNGACSCGDYW
ncbi:pentatricopeptide repeat-containing protein At3g46790, chloroplastic [Selaginella moellendorffii]|uniref:pentatricopeptide repeat-containing protein At3g46790, chloroplastic n=1 Tax=Selaginella moellendorffii TaxID=88036 RepID=UPI000D1C9640|nr:pentatricopeptide repeat-containing protein At3g46790, chloroplastic [Selaginella moellendorffii]|eukprot:XP_024542405.1 pentatricopeptide repeat-containing protein At3g46790, chloroplastic [Selaginella moellendorffii]